MTIKPEKNQWTTTHHERPGYSTTYGPGPFGSGGMEEWRTDGGSDAFHRYTGKSGDYMGDPEVDSYVSVVHRGAEGSTKYPPKEMLGGTDPVPEDWLPPASTDSNVGQISLLKNRSTHANSMIDSAFGTKAARVGTMTGVGMAINKTLEEYGRVPEPSWNLSKHSANLVNRMQDRGAISKDVNYQATNGIDFWDPGEHERVPAPYETMVPNQKVEAGRRVMRSVARRPRKSGGEQMELPF